MEEIIETELLDISFFPKIAERGMKYYLENKVKEISNDGDTFYAKVEGTGDFQYEVEIEFDEDRLDTIDYSCTCFCDYPCKHLYAALMTIINTGKTSLLPEVKKDQYKINELLEKTPSKELKEILIDIYEKDDDTTIDSELLRKKLFKYDKKESYNYYYTLIYNNIIRIQYRNLQKFINLTNDFIKEALFEDAFKVIKAIIEVYKDQDLLLDDEFNKSLPILKMYLRIAFRHGDNNLKIAINNYLYHINNKNFYNSIFLEDFIKSL